MANNRINIVITADDKASKPIRDVAGAMDDGSDKSSRLAGALGVLGRAATVAAVTGIAATTAGLGSLITYSFNATRQVQGYVAGIRGLTESSEQAGDVIKSMVDYVQGKPFDRIEVLGAARNLLVFGRSAEETKKDIELLGRAVVVSGSDFQSLSQIFGRVASSGRMMTDDFNQLMYAGVNIGATLTKNLGVDMAQLRKDMSDGKVSFEEFRKALEEALPANAVEEASNTIDNKLLTLRASFRNLGFTILGVDFSKVDGAGMPLVAPGGLLDRLVKGVTDLSNLLKSQGVKDAFATATRLMLDLGDTMGRLISENLPPLIAGVLDLGTRIGDYLGPKFQALWQVVQENLMPALGRLWREFIQPLIPVIGTALVVAFGAAVDAGTFFVSMLSGLINFLSSNQWVIWAAIGAFTAFKGALAIEAAKQNFEAAISGIHGQLDTTRSKLDGINTSLGSIGWMAAGAAASIGLQIIIDKTTETLNVVRQLGDAIDKTREEGRKTDEAIMKRFQEGKISVEDFNNYIRSTEQVAQNTIQNTKHMYDGFLGPLNRSLDNLFVRMSGAQEQFKGTGFGGFASGTNYAPGGWTWVGERGPELAKLPQGTQVMQSYRSRSEGSPASSGAPTVNMYGDININNGGDEYRLLSNIGFALELRS